MTQPRAEREAELAALMGGPKPMVTQAHRVLTKMGGPGKLARALADAGTPVSREQIYRWTYPPERGGTGGLIPQTSLRKILALARTIGVLLSPTDLDPRETIT